MPLSRVDRGALVVAGVVSGLAAVGEYLKRRVWLAPHPEPEDVTVASPVLLGDSGQKHLLVMLLALVLLGCGVGGWSWWNTRQRHETLAVRLVGGQPHRGPELLRRYGCGGCHAMQGVPGVAGRVGPPLDDIGQRVYLAGVLPNTPENLVRWIHDPRGVAPRSAMPNTGISPAEAREVAAYLLRQSAR